MISKKVFLRFTCVIAFSSIFLHVFCKDLINKNKPIKIGLFAKDIGRITSRSAQVTSNYFFHQVFIKKYRKHLFDKMIDEDECKKMLRLLHNAEFGFAYDVCRLRDYLIDNYTFIGCTKEMFFNVDALKKELPSSMIIIAFGLLNILFDYLHENVVSHVEPEIVEKKEMVILPTSNAIDDCFRTTRFFTWLYYLNKTGNSNCFSRRTTKAISCWLLECLDSRFKYLKYTLNFLLGLKEFSEFCRRKWVNYVLLHKDELISVIETLNAAWQSSDTIQIERAEIGLRQFIDQAHKKIPKLRHLTI